MVPIFFTIDNDLPVMIIPDTQAHVDGHPVLTYRYNVYYDEGFNNKQEEREDSLLLQSKTDPGYMGQIVIEDPGRLFTYIADGKTELTTEQVEEIIENINHYRDHPSLWQY
ncbi:hypothetical protein EOD41_15200 [Mucilaginibacter limnophilus]|uniref:Uncharacterized protein n=1 Tax=Mucilaginibacter limnophilus TaxID=1932778 RepID=A0A437MQ76_9SPHI|nr:hypothetical protein [Mucilaginibacter limnophilus]RVT99787.1 hypothetical protein EOD41_15200 [Mucilaginibacter limnophilus]